MEKLKKVLERNDYCHLNGVLAKRVREISAMVAEKMEELEVNILDIDEIYSFKMTTYNDCSKFLTMVEKGNEEKSFVSDTNCLWDGYDYYNTKFSSYYEDYGLRRLSTKRRLAILNNVEHIADLLNLIEDEKSEMLKKALGIEE